MFCDLIVKLSADPDINRDLEAVVRSTLTEFLTVFSGCPPAGRRPLHVSYTPQIAITDSTTDPRIYRIELSVCDRFYCQLVFQLGHELCHVFADPRRSNWFVECCCAMVSLLLLWRLSETWIFSPPFPNWTTYAPEFREYAEGRVRQATNDVFGSDSLPDSDQLHKWLISVRPSLLKNLYERERNVIISEMIRPFFEKSAESWDALRFLGQASVPSPVDLTDFKKNADFRFDRWFEAVPNHLKQIVREVRDILDDEPPVEIP